MKNINDIFDSLAQNSSRNAKEDILRQHSDNETFKRAIFLALDPFTQFYIRKIPKYERDLSDTINLDDAMDYLAKLSSREMTGNKAIDTLLWILKSCSTDDAKVIERIIKKDLRCGVSDATANKIWKDFIPVYPCMLASGYDDKLVDKMTFPAFTQTKLDGMRFNAIIEGDTVVFRSRNGKEIDIKNDLLKKAFLKAAENVRPPLSDIVFDGELLIVDESGKVLDRQTGNGILNKAVKGTISAEESKMVRATVWDIIPLVYFRAGKFPMGYKDRLTTVVTAVDKLGDNFKHLISVVDTAIVNNAYEAEQSFKKAHDSGLEGIILKSFSGTWEDKRAKHQIKYKGELECDLKVVDVEEGSGKYKGLLGALVCASSDNVVRVSVGSGFSDAQRKEFKGKSLIGSIVTVKYNQRIKNQENGESLFLPIFVEVRLDKSTADSSKKIK